MPAVRRLLRQLHFDPNTRILSTIVMLIHPAYADSFRNGRKAYARVKSLLRGGRTSKLWI